MLGLSSLTSAIWRSVPKRFHVAVTMACTLSFKVLLYDDFGVYVCALLNIEPLGTGSTAQPSIFPSLLFRAVA